uniref:Transmembrane protein n=1 Tax=Echinostoma caproni TaxID=27848 RepID=A0A183BDW3_9TREM
LPAYDDESVAGVVGTQSWWPLFGLTWIHLFALIILTLLVAIFGHVMTKSATLVSNSSGSGSSVTKNLPTAVPPSLVSPLHSSPRKLWSQGYTISPTRAVSLTSQSPQEQPQQMFNTGVSGGSHLFGPNVHQRYRSGGSPIVSDSGDLLLEEQRWRNALTGNSPRLRDTFDSI